jgi:hypothetical protein
MWLKADAGVTLSGSNVTAWADQSESGIIATPFDANPTYNSSDLNGKPTITLSRVSVGDNESLSLDSSPMGASGTTAFVVNYVDPDVFPVDGEGGDANGALLGNFGSAENGSHWPYGLGGTASVYDSFATDTRKDDLGLPGGITNWNIYSVHSQNDDYKLFCNGIQFHSDVSNVYSNTIGGNGTLYIGMQNNAGTDQIFKGKVAEIVIYNRVLTTPERQQVEQYLNSKYQIYPWRITTSGAGTTTSNDEYVWDGVTTYENKPVYNAISGSQIFWVTALGSWILYDNIEGNDTYSSTNLTTWTVEAGSSPAPSATFSYTQPPAPSEIPYSTSQIFLGGFNNTNVGVDRTSPIMLTKQSPTTPYEWLSSGSEGYYVSLFRSPSSGTWTVYLLQFGEEGFGTVTCATNPSTTLTEIPTTGWVLESGVTGTITITAV